MLRVLHVTNAYPYPEVPEYGVFVKEQIESVAAAGVNCELVFINGRRDGKKAYLQAVSEIRNKARGVDVIHCHHLYSGLATYLAGTGKPIILSFLNDWLHEMDGVRSLVARKILCNVGVALAQRVIFKSPIPPKFSGNAKFVHLPNGVDAERFYIIDKYEARQRLGLSPGAIYLLFVSSKDKHRAQKRYDRFKAVLDILQTTYPTRDYRELILVNQPRDRVLDFFNAADAHLLTSDFEGSPNSVKEALCCGVPVVSTNVGNVAQMLAAVPFSAVVQSSEPQELAEIVAQMPHDSVNRRAIRNAITRTGPTTEITVGMLVKLYKSAL